MAEEQLWFLLRESTTSDEYRLIEKSRAEIKQLVLTRENCLRAVGLYGKSMDDLGFGYTQIGWPPQYSSCLTSR
jgi:hypothetical protein